MAYVTQSQPEPGFAGGKGWYRGEGTAVKARLSFLGSAGSSGCGLGRFLPRLQQGNTLSALEAPVFQHGAHNYLPTET